METLRERLEDLIGIKRLQSEEYRCFLKEESDPETVHTIVLLIAHTDTFIGELQTILDETL